MPEQTNSDALGTPPNAGDQGAAGATPQGQAVKPDLKDERPPDGDKSAWLERVDRAKRAEAAKAEAAHRAWLKERFGTEDQAEADKKLAALAKLEADEERRRRDAMSEQERLQADLKREREARAKAEARAIEAESNRMIEKQSTAIERIASGHIASEYAEDVMVIFARHVRQLSKDDQAAMTEKDVAKWFADFAKRKPAFAAQRGPAPAPEPKQDPKKVPVGAGAPPGQPPPKPTAGGVVKTMRPGQPNSMSDQEYRRELRKQGFSY